MSAERVRVTTHTNGDQRQLVVESLDNPERVQHEWFDHEDEADAWVARCVEHGDFVVAEEVWS